MQIPPPSPQLPDVVVTGARLPTSEDEAAFSVVRLDADDLRAQQLLVEALAAAPAVSPFRATPASRRPGGLRPGGVNGRALLQTVLNFGTSRA